MIFQLFRLSSWTSSSPLSMINSISSFPDFSFSKMNSLSLGKIIALVNSNLTLPFASIRPSLTSGGLLPFSSSCAAFIAYYLCKNAFSMKSSSPSSSFSLRGFYTNSELLSSFSASDSCTSNSSSISVSKVAYSASSMTSIISSICVVRSATSSSKSTGYSIRVME